MKNKGNTHEFEFMAKCSVCNNMVGLGHYTSHSLPCPFCGQPLTYEKQKVIAKKVIAKKGISRLLTKNVTKNNIKPVIKPITPPTHGKSRLVLSSTDLERVAEVRAKLKLPKKMTGRRKFTPAEIKALEEVTPLMKQLQKEGKSQTAIAGAFGLGMTTTVRILNNEWKPKARMRNNIIEKYSKVSNGEPLANERINKEDPHLRRQLEQDNIISHKIIK